VGGWTRDKLRQWWWIAFALGLLMINYPFLQIFNTSTFVFGLPLLFLYFFVGWAVSIGVIVVYAVALRRAPPEEQR
jgi:hypothetical protein